MVLLIAGILMLVIAAFMNVEFRLRMSAAGFKWALLQAGAFDYSKYHKLRKEHGWAAWPVYLMWALLVCGIILLIAGFFIYFGTSPRHR